MRFLITADWHLHNHKAYSKIVDGKNSRLGHIEAAISQSISEAHENGATAMIIAGDVFDVGKSVSPTIQMTAAGLFSFAKNKFYNGVYIVAGNHDQEGGYYSTALDIFDWTCDINLMTPGAYKQIGEEIIVGYPFERDVEEFKEYYKNRTFSPTISVLHFGIDNFKPNKGMPDTGLNVEFFGDDVVISGHYHSPRLVNNVLSPGSPIPLRKNEGKEDHGYWIYDSDNNSFEFFKLDYPEFVEIHDGVLENVDGNIVIAHVKSAKEADTISKKLDSMSPEYYEVVIEPHIVKNHDVDLSVSDINGSLITYIDSNKKFSTKKKDLLEINEEVKNS